MKLSEVEVRYEAKRGCGRRKEGGLYLVAGAPNSPCGKLPLPLRVCPTCGAGIKHSRGWKWIEPRTLLADKKCRFELQKDLCGKRGNKFGPESGCDGTCPLSDAMLATIERAGLLWVGKEFYKTPADYMEEAHKQGISRRIKAVPKDFVLGETWVLLAHVEGAWEPCPEKEDPEHGDDCDECGGTGAVAIPAVFTAFRPQAIEYVCHEDECEAEIDAMLERGITPVRVKPLYDDKEQAGLPLEVGDAE